MEKRNKIDSGRYAYAAGRIRALEASLIGSARLARYYEARTIEDIGRLLVENGYPAAPDPESSLSRGLEQSYALARQISPDAELIDALLLARDFHNLRVMLKSFAVYWPRRQAESLPGSTARTGAPAADNLDRSEREPSEAAEKAGIWPEIHAPVTLEQLEPMLQRPATIEPAVMFRALREQRASDLPPAMAAAAAAATVRYLRTYDISEIDIHLDKVQARLLSQAAERTDNAFFRNFVRLRIDLVNVGLLLRTRFLKSSADYLRCILLPGGSLAPDALAGLYDEPAARIASVLSHSALAPLAGPAEHFAEGGDAIARFSQAQDEVLMRYVRQGKRVLRGPEVVIGYLIAREMEIRTVRIILTCLRNGIPLEKARELARLTYL